VIIAQYDPRILINRFASPNKLYTAMGLGRPIIVNQELSVAGWIRHQRIGYTIPYGDADALSALVQHFLTDPGEVERTGQRGRNLYEEKYRWEQIEEGVRQAFREGLPASRDK
jgi:glycosyltransferase involved in cell wall biosynthesis